MYTGYTDTPAEMRVCRYCDEEKNILEFRESKDGRSRRWKCKDCQRADDRKRYERNKARPPSDIDAKICSTCKENKSIDNFYRVKARDDGWDSLCKDCRKELSNRYRNKERARELAKIWREDNIEHQRRYRKEYRSRPEVIEHERAYSKAYRSRPEVKERNRIAARERRKSKKYQEFLEKYEKSPEYLARKRIQASNRRRMEGSPLPRDTWERMLDFYGEACMNPECETHLTTLCKWTM